MNGKCLLSISLILCTLDAANADSALDITRPLDSNNEINVVSKPVEFNDFKKNIKETKNALKKIKKDLASNNYTISDLKKDLTGKTVTVNPENIEIDNSSSFSIISNKSKNQDKAINSDIVNLSKNKTEQKTPQQLMKEWRDDYMLNKHNAKVFIAKTPEQLKNYIEELNKPHSYNMIVFDKMCIDNALGDILKNKPKYKNLLRNNINYSILINLFALNANENPEVFKEIEKQLDEANFDLKVFTKIVEIYKEADAKINEKNTDETKINSNKKLEISHPNSFGINKYTKENADCFSIIGNKNNQKNKYSKWDDIKIDDEKKVKEFNKRISQLETDKKKMLQDSILEVVRSDEINLPSNLEINDKSIAQCFGADDPQDPRDPNKNMCNVFCLLAKQKLLAKVLEYMIAYNPFMELDIIIKSIFEPFFVLPIAQPETVSYYKKTETPNTKEILMISQSVTPVMSSFQSVSSLVSSASSSVISPILSVSTFDMKPSVSGIFGLKQRSAMFDRMFNSAFDYSWTNMSLSPFSSSMLFGSLF